MIMRSLRVEINLEKAILTLNYTGKHLGVKLPARLLYVMLLDKRTNFVSFEKIDEMFRVFTPVLEEIESEKLEPLSNVRGSKGPLEAT
ncbi:hypothetical protein HHI36_009659, partial [Cryptolaemus montrouzieri]